MNANPSHNTPDLEPSEEGTGMAHPQPSAPSESENLDMHGITEQISSNGIMEQEITRKQLIRSNLHHQVVLPDNSNVSLEGLRERNHLSKLEDATKASDDKEEENDDESSIIVSDYAKKPSTTTRNHSSNSASSSSSTSFLYLRVRNLMSSWRQSPRKTDICSICLEVYREGQTICVARNYCCDHMFHEECIQSWLMDHDHCPLCRLEIVY